MPVVSNTSPILNLALIDRLSLLHEQFGIVHITQGVLDELRVTEQLPGCQQIRSALDEGWLQVKQLKDSALMQTLMRELDRGEAESIVQALETKAERVLLDESEARRIAKDLGLNVTGVLGILLRAYRQKRFKSLKKEMERLRERAGFYIADQLFEDLLRSGKNK